MPADSQNWTPSDYAAWWGAAIASIALGWNIVTQLRSGPRIVFYATPGMLLMPPSPLTKDRQFIRFSVTNSGTVPLTITNICGIHAKRAIPMFKGKKSHFVMQTEKALSDDFNKLISPGEDWNVMVDQKGIEELFSGGALYLGVVHNRKKKPIYKRVKLDANQAELTTPDAARPPS